MKLLCMQIRARNVFAQRSFVRRLISLTSFVLPVSVSHVVKPIWLHRYNIRPLLKSPRRAEPTEHSSNMQIEREKNYPTPTLSSLEDVGGGVGEIDNMADGRVRLMTQTALQVWLF